MGDLFKRVLSMKQRFKYEFLIGLFNCIFRNQHDWKVDGLFADCRRCKISGIYTKQDYREDKE